MSNIKQILQKVAAYNKTASNLRDCQNIFLNEALNEQDRMILSQEINILKESLVDNSRIKSYEVINLLSSQTLNTESLKDMNLEYLLDNTVIKGEITMIAAAPGEGKSSFALCIANHCLLNENVEHAIYLDLDNSLVTLAERNVHELKEKYGKKFMYIHSTSVSKFELNHSLMMISRTNLANTIIFFDSIKNFMGHGSDRDKNKDVTEFMHIIKKIRDSGCTVIILHHVNKPQKDVETIFAGAAAWMEDVSSLLMLTQNRYKSCFVVTPKKERVGCLKEMAYSFDKSKNEIQECNLLDAKETEEMEYIRKNISAFIASNPSAPTYSEIMEYGTGELGLAKNKVNHVIQSGRKRYWNAIKEKVNYNRDVYVLLDISDSLDN